MLFSFKKSGYIDIIAWVKYYRASVWINPWQALLSFNSAMGGRKFRLSSKKNQERKKRALKLSCSAESSVPWTPCGSTESSAHISSSAELSATTSGSADLSALSFVCAESSVPCTPCCSAELSAPALTALLNHQYPALALLNYQPPLTALLNHQYPKPHMAPLNHQPHFLSVLNHQYPVSPVALLNHQPPFLYPGSPVALLLSLLVLLHHVPLKCH